MAYQPIGGGSSEPAAYTAPSEAIASYSPEGTSGRSLEDQAVKVNKYETSLPMRADIEAALTYLFGCITGVLFLILEQKNDYVRFNAWQSTLLFFGMLALHMCFIWQNIISIILMVVDILLIAFLMFTAYKNAQDSLVRFELPIIGKLASKWVDSE